MGVSFHQWHDACEFTPDKGRLTIAMDGDDAGRKAGFTLATRAHKQSFDVFMMQAPKGTDFNNVLLSQKREL
ncbi:hypothetical protein GCM10023261_18070 [Bartonella jaculi]|uniref:Toprim domain-containing protein n=1 Tax=Bartonella jaculi TaxID=686226 RepID=A0ABP8VBI2_9HYPH